MEKLKAFEGQLLKWAYKREYRESILLKSLIFMGDGPFWLLVVFISALIGHFLKMEVFFRLSILLMVGLMIGNVVFVFCKTKVKRKRPYADVELQKLLNIEIVNRDVGHGSKELESFPSGHVFWTTLCVGIIYSQFGSTALILLGWMIPVMMFLRLHLGVHYPSDILAAVILAITDIFVTLLLGPGFIEQLNTVKNTVSFQFVYWIFIIVFMTIGFKSWLKRV